jgi:two-component system invasion response regulator UvrY
MMNVVIADDHTLVREGLRSLLREQNESISVHEARNGSELLQKIESSNPALVFIDTALPEKNGLEALKQVKEFCRSLPVIMISSCPENKYGIQAIKSGAAGVISKTAPLEELMQAFTRVLSGRRYISPALAEMIALDLEVGSNRSLHERLTPREYTVLCQLATGRRTKDISRRFSLSINTVHTYKTRILKKMNMRTGAELIRYAIKNGLVD